MQLNYLYFQKLKVSIPLLSLLLQAGNLAMRKQQHKSSSVSTA